MDKIRKALNGRRTSSPAYEPLPDANGHEGHDAPSGNHALFSWLEYSIFLLLGVSMLWAWNVFLAASPYFQGRFSPSPYLLTHFPAYITSVSTITNLASVTLLAQLQRSASYPLRIIASLCLNFLSFTCLAISTTFFRSVSVQGYFAFLMLVVFTANLATGLCQNGVLAYVAGFGVPEYTQAIMVGQAIAGVLPCITQIVSVLSVQEHEESNAGIGISSKSALIYFLTATVICLFTLVAFLYLLRSRAAHEKRIESMQGVDDAQEEEHVERKVVGMWTLFKKLRYTSLAVFICFVVTMFFPIYTQKILSVRHPDTAPRILQPACFIPLAFLLWNSGDLIGRLLTGISHLNLVRWPRTLFWLSILRLVFIPLYLVCNVQGKGAIINSDVFYLVIVQFLFGLTNGFVGSTCMMGANEWVEQDEREAAGGFMGLMLVGGLAVGSLLSFTAA
ncbi:MAG: hypothetical protein Q9219_004739 [cf. Caloplaca sp. 3 TL-2023]